VRDLWYDKHREKTARHPDRGGNKDAKRWLAIWLDPDRQEKTRAFARQSDAFAYGKRMESDAARGEYIDPKAGNGLVGPLARKHLGLQKIGATTRRQYESALANHVDPKFASRTVRSVKPSEIAEWLTGPLSDYSASIQQTAFFLLRGTFDLAVADNLRRDNPARSPIIEPPAKADRKPRILWDADTAWRVIAEHPEPYRAIPVCEAGLGMRQGCAFALAGEDIDFDAMTVDIRRQVVRVRGEYYFSLPKYGKTRTVPMSRGVAAFLKGHMDKYPPRPYSLPWMGEHGKTGPARTCRLLFRWHGDDRRTRGRHIVTANYDKGVWYPALSRAGVGPPPADKGRRYNSPGRANGSHILRHLFETMLDEGGVSLAGQMEFMGHSRKGQPITIGVYSHVTAETLERARQAIDAALFKLRPVESNGTLTELRSAR
jgi:integrase